ncbi:MAG: hypothetical protein KDA31_00045 [Phycisphaerales bacterium]|nr:hypothetical protein [Phycisphaerales bacterium]MCB9837315.1 hypothetical protein [Phycisphaera sp.]
MTRPTLSLSLALASALLTSAAVAQDDSAPAKQTQKADASLPDAYDVLQKHVEAIGGYEKNKAFEAVRMSGDFEMPAMNIAGSIVISSKAPSSTVIEVNLGAIGRVEQGTNGTVAWTSQPGQEPQVIEGPTAETLKNQADFYAQIEPKKTYVSAETVAVVEHDGVRCYKLNLETKWGEHQVGLYEVESGLMRKLSIRASAESDHYINETGFSDYAEIQGVKHARRLELINGGIKQLIVFKDVELDPEFANGHFDPPGAL